MRDVLASRYASEAMKQIWSEESKIKSERKLWIAVMKAQTQAGLQLPESVIKKYEQAVESIDLASIGRREAHMRHDVKARVEEFNALAGEQSIHLGMTSRDLTENIEILQIRDSLRLIQGSALGVLARFAEKANEFQALPIVGRSHNVPAQLTTLGKRFATWIEELLFALERLDSLSRRLPLRGLRGPVGTSQDLIDLLGQDSFTKVEELVAQELGFDRILDSTGQIYPRSVDFEVISTLVQISAALSSFATTVRLMAGAGLVSEGFKSGQVGSSAMPHKVNTRSSERINGLAVVLRGHLSMVSELVGDQWNEGDVSCSVVRRVALPGAFYALDGILQTVATVLQEMRVFPEKIAKEVDENLPFLSTTRILIEAVKKGMGREDAHQIIKEHSLEAIDRISCGESSNLIESLGADPKFPLNHGELEELLSHPGNLIGDAANQVMRILVRTKQVLSSSKIKQRTSFDEIR